MRSASRVYSFPRKQPFRPPLGSWRRFSFLLSGFVAFLILQNQSSLLSGEPGLKSWGPTTVAIPVSFSDAHREAETTSRESTEANDKAAAAAAELVDTLDAAREAADHLRRVAAVAAHKKRVADRAAAVAAAALGSQAKPASTEIATARERKVRLQDGSEASFSVFGRSDEDVSVFVLPYDTQRKRFTLIEEYHPGPNQKMIGLVAGMFESKHGGSPEKAAIWELSEEARLKMGEDSQLLDMAPEASGGFSQDKYSSAHFRPFLALNCIPDNRPRPRDREEDIMIHSDVSPEDLQQMILNGKLNMPSTAFAIMGLQALAKRGLL